MYSSQVVTIHPERRDHIPLGILVHNVLGCNQEASNPLCLTVHIFIIPEPMCLLCYNKKQVVVFQQLAPIEVWQKCTNWCSVGLVGGGVKCSSDA